MTARAEIPKPGRVAQTVLLTLGLSLMLLAVGGTEAKAEPPCNAVFGNRICKAFYDTTYNYVSSGQDETIYNGGARVRTWNINGGFVKTCWYMRTPRWARVRMAAQGMAFHWPEDIAFNKNTVEKVVDSTWRLYCDAATAKTWNQTRVEAWLRVLDGTPVYVAASSAYTLTPGKNWWQP